MRRKLAFAFAHSGSTLADSTIFGTLTPRTRQTWTTLALTVLKSPAQMRLTWLGCTEASRPISALLRPLAEYLLAILLWRTHNCLLVGFMQISMTISMQICKE